MTQSGLAKASGVSHPQIARYERGESNPRMTALVKLAKALGVPVSKLTHEDEEPDSFEMKLSIGSDEWSMSVPQQLVDELNEIHRRLGGDETSYQVVLMMIGVHHKEGKVDRAWIESMYRLSMKAAEEWPRVDTNSAN